MSFKSVYQGGPFFEILSTQGKDGSANWKFSSPSIKKAYEKDVKGYVFTLEGAPATTKVQSPKDQKQSLTLVQRFLVVQVYITKGADFSIELGVSDLSSTRRRILLSSSLKETQVTPLHAKVPLTIVKRAVWLNLVLDMVSMVGETWTAQTFRAVDHISVSANCKLRRVFTMKSQPLDTTDDDELYGCSSTNSGDIEHIPKSCQMAPDVNQCTQVLTLNKVRCAERFKARMSVGDQMRTGSTLDLDLSSTGRKVHTSDGRIAFGAKAPPRPHPDSGRKTARQGSLTNRSLKSQTSRQDTNTSNSNNRVGSGDSLTGPTPIDHKEFSKPSPPVSASAVPTPSRQVPQQHAYNRQQSEPVTQEDYGFIGINGLRDSQLVAPHPPREPSNDRVRRRPRIKSIGQNGITYRGEPYTSPPTSGLASSRQGSGGSRSHPRLDEDQEIDDPERSMKDSGVGPDVPEIQSPRKGDFVDSICNDSVSDFISLLKSEGMGFEERKEEMQRANSKEEKRKEDLKDKEWGYQGEEGEIEDNLSSSASEGSHPGEYEESDEESSEDKLHRFFSPPKSAARRNISPSSAEAEINQSKRSFVKTFRSNVKHNGGDKGHRRSAKLEDDFVSRSSSEEDMMALKGADLLSCLPHPMSRKNNGAPSHRHHPHHSNGNTNSSGYNSNNYSYASSSASSPRFKPHEERHSININSRSHSRPTEAMVPPISTSPDHKPTYDSSIYSDSRDSRRDSVKSSVSRMSRKSVREITNPRSDMAASVTASTDKPYNATRYQAMSDITESFEAQMFASMQGHVEDEYEDVSPPPQARVPLTTSQQYLSATDMSSGVALYSESPATTSDDDTSFSTWKPAPDQAPHNYQEEMKSRRSNDTLTSSNPRDWSSLLSPPVDPQGHDLQGTLEGISDDLSDELAQQQDKQRNGLKSASGEGEEKLDLVFDPKLNCYYDPKTQKWYELVP